MDKEAFERKKAERQKKLEEYERQKEEKRKKDEERKKNGPRAYKKKEGVAHGRPRKNPETPERVTDAGKPSINEIISQIDEAIEEYKALCIQYKTYDPQKPYNAYLWANTCHYVGQRVFKGKELLQESHPGKNGGTPPFIPERIEAIYNYYYGLTQLHNSTVRVFDFAEFIGTSMKVLYDSNTIATAGRGYLPKKIMQEQEAGLASMLQAGKGSTTGIAMILNVKHGWTQSREVVHTDATTHISARDLPRLGGGGPEPLEIEEKE